MTVTTIRRIPAGGFPACIQSAFIRRATADLLKMAFKYGFIAVSIEYPTDDVSISPNRTSTKCSEINLYERAARYIVNEFVRPAGVIVRGKFPAYDITVSADPANIRASSANLLKNTFRDVANLAAIETPTDDPAIGFDSTSMEPAGADLPEVTL